MKLDEIIFEMNISRNCLALEAKISPGDLYSALSGKRPFYPSWRKRIADALAYMQE